MQRSTYNSRYGYVGLLIGKHNACRIAASSSVQADSAAKLPMSTHPLLLASISAAAGAATGALLCAYLLRASTNVPSRAAAAAGAAGPAAAPSIATTLQLDCLEEDDILQEQLTRNVQFFGLEKQKRIGSSFVVVIGLGVCLSASNCCTGILKQQPQEHTICCGRRVWGAMQPTCFCAQALAASGWLTLTR